MDFTLVKHNCCYLIYWPNGALCLLGISWGGRVCEKKLANAGKDAGKRYPINRNCNYWFHSASNSLSSHPTLFCFSICLHQNGISDFRLMCCYQVPLTQTYSTTVVLGLLNSLQRTYTSGKTSGWEHLSVSLSCCSGENERTSCLSRLDWYLISTYM